MISANSRPHNRTNVRREGIPIDLKVTHKQQAFIDAKADEVLYGGAAGGGKSYGQLIDAFLYALKYPGSRQLMLRRTFPELEKSLIRDSREIFAKEVCKYHGGDHLYNFKNGSLVEFGYCDRDDDKYKYQSVAYNVIRFDELTHFTEEIYTYLVSRCRGANKFPKAIKSSTNPGGVGHYWVKQRFIDIGEPNKTYKFEVEIDGKKKTMTRIFIPAKVQDNKFIMEDDPDYIFRMKATLGKDEQRALIYGDWNLTEGRFFSEWDPDIHVIKPFNLPDSWRRYFAMDYGLDMLAGYFIAVDEQGRAIVYKEIYKPNLIISDAAKLINEYTNERIYEYFAPPDLWNRRQDTGRNVAEIFGNYGIWLTKTSNDRVQGWLNLKEWLRPTLDEFGNKIANLRVFSTCTNLINHIPSLQHDKKNPNDCSKDPHNITHAPDAIRYFIAGRPRPVVIKPPSEIKTFDEQLTDFEDFRG